MSETGSVALELFDITGRKVMGLVNSSIAKGYNTIQFDGSELSSRVYYYRLSGHGFVQTRQLVLVK